MTEFLQNNIGYLINGVSVGGQYALIAIGYTMVYGILRLINFAHGDVFMVAGLMIVYMSTIMPIWITLIFVLIITAMLGFFIERIAYRPLRSAPRMSVMISAIGVSYLLQNCALYFSGGLPQVFPTIQSLSKTVDIWGTQVMVAKLVTPILTLILIFVLLFLIKKTKIGMAMRAVSKDFETSQLMGIKIDLVISATFVLGCFLAAVGAILYFTCYPSVAPTSGSMPGLKAFVAAVFGGIGSIPGAVIGAFIIGIFENIIKGGSSIFGIQSTGWTTFSDAFSFALLIIILMVKPTGIFGEKATDKV